MIMDIIKYIREPWRILVAFDMHVWSIVPDEMYLKAYCRSVSGQRLDLKKPVTYCEKLNWLKLHDKNPLYGIMVDKIAVRKYISELYGDEYLVPLLGIYDSADEIDFSKLPNRFVLKCSHDSGSAVICKSKNELDYESVRKKLNNALKVNFGRKSRETPYSFITERRIIAEKYIYDDDDISIKPDYKFFCFNGVVKMFQVNIGRTSESGVRVNFYDRDKKTLSIIEAEGYGKTDDVILPSNIDNMIELAELFSKGIPHVRVDFLTNGEKIYFSEFTFYHCGGFYPFSPDKWNYIIGNWITLPSTNEIRGENAF